MLDLRCGYLSIKGNFRDNNEDAAAVSPEHLYFIVADGMGGQSAGEKASELATELVPQMLEQLIDFDSGDDEQVRRGIDEAVAHANSEIMALGEVDPAMHNMGTTIVFIVVVDGHFFVSGVGDSRAYRLRDGNLEQITTDHSLTQALVDAGTISKEEAATHRYRNVLYRYLGTKEGGTGTDAKKIRPEPGDRYMLCSDGVTDGAANETIHKLLSELHDPQKAAEAIIEAAQEGGSRDNITCVVVHVA